MASVVFAKIETSPKMDGGVRVRARVLCLLRFFLSLLLPLPFRKDYASRLGPSVRCSL